MTKIRFAGANDAAQMAVVHHNAFSRPWSDFQIERMFIIPGTFGLLALAPDPELEVHDPVGMILVRAVTEQSDLLTIGVDPDFRRQGIGRKLLAYAMAEAQRRGSDQMFLEVADDNRPAINLYGNFGFKTLSKRKNYYTVSENRRADALLMGCPLTQPLPPLS